MMRTRTALFVALAANASVKAASSFTHKVATSMTTQQKVFAEQDWPASGRIVSTHTLMVAKWRAMVRAENATFVV